MTAPWLGRFFIVDLGERTAKGIQKSPEQGEKEVDWSWPADWTEP